MTDTQAGRIALWPFSGKGAQQTVAVVKKKDLEEYRYFVSEGEVDKSLYVYYLVPEANKFADVLLYWLKYEKFPQFSIDNAQQHISAFFSAWEQYCGNPISMSEDFVRLAGQVMPVEVTLAVPSFEYLGDFLTAVFERCIRRMLYSQGMYHDYQPSNAFRSWWQFEPDAKANLDSELTALKQHAEKCNELYDLLDMVSGISHQVAALRNSRIDRALDAAAILCFMSGEVASQLRHPSTAVVYFHRALDFFLQSRCSENGLVKETGRGLEFTFETREERVGVASCYKALIDNHVYLSRKSLAQTIRACNDIRNNSVFTHSLFGSTDNYSRRYRDSIYRCLEQIDRDAARRLVRASKRITDGLRLNPSLIFCLEKDLRNFVVETTA
jgi:hypothetical protein